MFAVAGVSGRTGAATATALLRQGQRVRVLVRTQAQGEKWLKRHAEVAVVDLTDGAALRAALAGITGLYLLQPPNPRADDVLADRGAFIEKVAHALKGAGLKSVLFLSSVGAQHPAGTGPVVALHRAEKALKGAAPSLTFLRAASFLENWSGTLLGALETGTLPFFGITHHKFPQVGAHDVGEAAAKALIASPPGQRVLELTGREPWSAVEVAEVLQSLLKTPVKAMVQSAEQARAAFEADGHSPSSAALWVEYYQAMGRGLLAFAHPTNVLHGTTSLYDGIKPLVD
jgi:uncharacterized protein YbjT (DUF2867 family)